MQQVRYKVIYPKIRNNYGPDSDPVIYLRLAGRYPFTPQEFMQFPLSLFIELCTPENTVDKFWSDGTEK